jgi:hypothetical protein
MARDQRVEAGRERRARVLEERGNRLVEDDDERV